MTGRESSLAADIQLTPWKNRVALRDAARKYGRLA